MTDKIYLTGVGVFKEVNLIFRWRKQSLGSAGTSVSSGLALKELYIQL